MSIKSLLPAELRRGATFGEDFESAEAVVDNGGVLGTGAIVEYNSLITVGTGGVTYDGQDFRNFVENGGSIKIQRLKYTGSDSDFGRFLEWHPDADTGFVMAIRPNDGELRLQIEKGGSSTGADIVTGTLLVDTEYDLVINWDGTSGIDIYVNAVESRDGIDTVGFGSVNDTLYAGRTLIGSMGDIAIFQGSELTQQEITDYKNGTTWNYREKATFDDPFGMEQHDATNRKSLDVSGHGNDLTFGTTTREPVKIAKHGYHYADMDFMSSASSDSLAPTEAVTMIMLVKLDWQDPAVSAYTWIGAVGFASGGTGGFSIFRYNDRINFAINQWNANFAYFPMPNDHKEEYHVVVGTYDKAEGNVRIYVDGEEGTPDPFAGDITYPTDKVLTFGKMGSAIQHPYNGEVNNCIVIPDLALTQLQAHDITTQLMEDLNNV